LILFQAFVPRNLEEVQSCDSATPGNDRRLLGSRRRGQTDRALCAGANQPTSRYIDRNRETERQKDRKTERQKDRKTERQKDRKTERQKDRKTERKTERHTERLKDIKPK
jgi:hypothetical protein